MLRTSTYGKAITTAIAMLLLGSVAFAGEPGEKEGSVKVCTTPTSGLIEVSIENHRKIGNVRMEVKDASGRTVYLEEGKAMSDELVRRLDKGMFAKGAATLTVETRDFVITQGFTVQ